MLFNSIEFLLCFKKQNTTGQVCPQKKGLLITLFCCSMLCAFNTSCINRCNGEGFRFRARLEVVTSHDNTLNISYLSKGSASQERQLLSVPVKAKDRAQFVEFCFPRQPQDMKLYFSEAKTGQTLRVLSALFENPERQMFIEEQEFFMYFINSRNVEYDKSKREYSFLGTNNTATFIKSRKPMNQRLKSSLKLQ